MKKRTILIGLLVAHLATFGQGTEKAYEKKQLARTDVNYLLSFYTQDNDHSAVTGGRGTEDLQVYVGQFAFNHQKDSTFIFRLETGVDIISSASTDNIDYNMSSASREDARTHLNLGYDRMLKNGVTAGMNGGFSIESDYLSYNAGFNLNRVNRDRSREVSMSAQAFFDDLRWGRFENGKAQKLIYPVELRNTNWFDDYRRTSYTVDVGIYQVINRRMAIGFYPGVAYQSGLLSTPFHRVYFNDGGERVEKLPDRRLKIPAGVQLNTFWGSYLVMRVSYRFYWDDFGIVSHAVNVEGAIKASPKFTITPFIRIYRQTAASSFGAYGVHKPDDRFYTSDYDLSLFNSVKPGASLRYTPQAAWGGTTFNAVEIRYAYYKRSDGMKAHMVTAFINYTVARKKK